MYSRLLSVPAHSFFLFGPRGTGKTTWLREHLSAALWKNLLLDRHYLPLLGDAGQLGAEVEALPAESWVVIDEVQRLPNLLNEVHNLISLHGRKYHFALSGSSARKLRRADVNLLAGRAIERRMHPLTSRELGQDFTLKDSLRRGTLPSVVTQPELEVDLLEAYVGTYLKQEIQQEALVEDIGSFHRFLRVAGLLNGEVVNVSSVARDAAVARSTVERYFDILVDTLVGVRLPGWQPRVKVRERLKPKFFFFDTGVVRTLCQRIRDPLSDLEVGKLLETYLLHELRSAVSYRNLGGELHYYRSSGGTEIDFIWTRGNRAVGLEVKASTRWQRKWCRPLQELREQGVLTEAFGVYRGQARLTIGAVQVLPVSDFLHALCGGEILA